MKKKISQAAFSSGVSSLGDLIVGLASGRFNKLLPVKKVAETNKAVTFWHPKRAYGVYILVVSKRPIKVFQLFTQG